jgi:hypothetical protein
MIPLKYNTASQEIPLGYFLDSTDGNAEETGLTIGNTDIKLWKNGAATLANKNAGGATHIANGLYYAVLDATDTNTIGPLVIFVHVAGALAVRVECCVYASTVYDALFTASGMLGVNVVGIAGTVQTAADLGAELAKVPKSDGSATFNVTCVSDIKSGLATPANIAGLEMDLVDAPNATAIAALQSGLATGANLATVDTVVDAIQAKTDNLPASPAAAGDIPAADITAIKAKTDQLTFTGTDLKATLDGEAVTLANGAHGGAASVLTLKQLAISNPDASAVLISSAGAGNSHAISATSTNGHGLNVGSQNGNGMYVGSVSSHAAIFDGGTNSDGIRALGDGAGYDINGDLHGTVDAVAGAVASVTAPVTAGTVSDKTGYALTGDYDAAKTAAQVANIPTAAQNAAGLLDLADGVESSWTLRQALRVILASLAGKLSGAATNTVTIRNPGDSKNRVTATVDGDGNRTAVSWDKS